ncbi:mechanosensitive ion channel family protein [Methylomusa anaerophila]|nr:mechanosensitive ion channel family protein [Methylomusa anaerophila]
MPLSILNQPQWSLGDNVEHILTSAYWIQPVITFFRLAAISIGGLLLLKFFNLVVERYFTPKPGAKTLYIDEKRARTLSSLLMSIIRYIIYFIIAVMVLQEFRIDTTSIIAGAGIIGVAVGIGAQGLIKDFITGFYIILEDQYGVGDYIVSENMAGTVEELGFRVTRLRDGNGVLHIIPNGSIGRISNYTRGHTQAVVTVPVSYQADIDKVLALLDKVCAEVGKSMPEVLAGPVVVGITDLGASEIIVKLTAKTVPLEQGKVETAIRHKVRTLFAAARIPPFCPGCPDSTAVAEAPN